MRRLVPMACLLLVSCAAVLQQPRTQPQTQSPYQSYYPPARFDHPFPGTTVVRDEEESVVRQHCPEAGVACVIERTDKLCVIVFNIAYAELRERVMRHERGHCNGWPPDHGP